VISFVPELMNSTNDYFLELKDGGYVAHPENMIKCYDAFHKKK
jgi:hypothetical protein